MIVIFGGTGLVGAHAAYALHKAGYGVRIGVRSSLSKQHVVDVFAIYGEANAVDTIDFYPLALSEFLDLCDFVRGADCVLNAAAQVSLAGYGRKGAEQLVRTNEDLASLIVEACLATGVERLIHIGSIAALGGAVDDAPVEETSSPQNGSFLSPYAQSKVAAARQIARGAAEGLKVHMLNPGVVLAPVTRKGSSAELVEWAMRGSRFYPDGLLAWVDVRDVAAAVCALVREPEALPYGSSITLVSDESSYFKFLSQMSAGSGGVRSRFCVSRRLAQLALPAIAVGRWLRFFSPSLSRKTVLSAYTETRYRREQVEKLGVFLHTLESTIHFITIQKK